MNDYGISYVYEYKELYHPNRILTSITVNHCWTSYLPPNSLTLRH